MAVWRTLSSFDLAPASLACEFERLTRAPLFSSATITHHPITPSPHHQTSGEGDPAANAVLRHLLDDAFRPPSLTGVADDAAADGGGGARALYLRLAARCALWAEVLPDRSRSCYARTRFETHLGLTWTSVE